MEKGRMSPPQDKDRLDQIAEVLGVEPGSDDYHALMDLAVAGKDRLPADVAQYAKDNEMVPVLLRTIENRKPTKKEFAELVRRLNEDLSKPQRG
jgi:hypothetical protein